MTLLHLRVHNLGVLDQADIDPSAGLTVITGETGAGKTLLLGGLRLILGGKADSGAVGPHDEAAQVDGLFEVADGPEVGASRTVPRTGRSRGYLDGAIVSADALAERLGTFVEIIGQHDQVSIARPTRLLDVVDSALDGDGIASRRGYQEAWKTLKEALDHQARLGGDPQELARELDLARYQAAEIDGAGLSPGIDAELETTASRLRNARETGEHLAEMLRIAEGVVESIGEVLARARKAAALDPTLGHLEQGAESLAADVTDLTRELREAGETLEPDETALADVEERLTAIGELKRKYGRTVEDVLAFGATTTERAAEIAGLLAEADRIDEVVAEARDAVAVAARELTGARERATKGIVTEALKHLADLGLETAHLELRMESTEPGPTGADRVELLFASDSRLEPGPIGAVASGGELSRLVLALRLAAAGHDTATLVFDEIDTGIGGVTALAMGEKLADLATRYQVLCVTHLPQVAAWADTHYVVERTTEGSATVSPVAGEERLVELSRMLAGQPESEMGKLAAAELLQIVGG